MRKLLHLIRTNEFIRHNGIFFIGSLAVSVLNYLYYPILGRLLSASDFGEVQALLSVLLEATIFLGVVTNVAVNIVANESDENLRNCIVYELEHLATIVMVGVLAIALLFVNQLRDFLQFDEAGPFFALAVALALSAPLSLRSAFLRGRSAFGQMSLVGIVGSITKLIFTVGFVLLGWRSLGAMGALIAAQIAALAYSVVAARKLGLKSDSKLKLWRRPDLAIVKPQLPYTALVLVVSVITTAMFSFDSLVVKHYFPAEIAGQYAGIATIARIIYFLTGSIAVVLLSSVKLESSPKANRHLLMRSMALHASIGGAALIVFSLAPQLIIRILIGAKYLPYAHLLPLLSLTLFILSLASLLFNYDLALRRVSAAFVAVVGGTFMLLIVLARHGSLEQLVASLFWGSVILLGLRGLDSIRRLFQGR